jgi:hypothetical protein
MPSHATRRTTAAPRLRTLGPLVLALLLGSIGSADGVRASASGTGSEAARTVVVVDAKAAPVAWSSSPGGGVQPLAWMDGDGATLVGSDGRRHFAAGRFELDARTRAAATLRDSQRLGLGLDLTSDAAPAYTVELRTEGPAGRGGSDEAPAPARWYRTSEGSTTLWWPSGGSTGASGSIVALGPAYSGDVEHVAAHLLGLELLATHQPELWARVRAAHVDATGRWIAAPGELWLHSRAALDALCRNVRAAIFASAHILDAQARMWDDGALAVRASLDGARVGELLFTSGQTSAAIGTALRTLTPERFYELHRELWDAATWRTVTLASAAPDAGTSFDLSRTAWDQSDEKARAVALRLLARAGGAEAWSALRAVRLDTTSRTSTQLDEQVADAVTVRVLDGALTHVAQQMEVQGTVQSFTTTIAGDAAWIESGSRLIVPEGEQLGRLLAGERRSLVRLLPRLAARRDVGVRLDEDGGLVLFDAHAVLGTLELDDEGDLVSFHYSDGTSTRHFVYEDAVEFGDLRYPGTYREVGGRGAEIVITGLTPLDEVDAALFVDPRR